MEEVKRDFCISLELYNRILHLSLDSMVAQDLFNLRSRITTIQNYLKRIQQQLITRAFTSFDDCDDVTCIRCP